jgi:Putative Flp pilus-assembly TadE/G-like
MIRAHIARPRDERGAVLVHVTVAIVGLLGFAALVIDYGVMWSSRRQAQNAADAAAMAGAISLAYDDPDDFDRARESAVKTGTENVVFGLSPNIDPDADISFPTCPPGAPGVPDTCVRANVYRNEDKDPLPTFFARLFGRSEQGVKATATAQLLTGNASDCIRPWAVMDKWQEVVKCTNFSGPNCSGGWVANPNPWTTEDTFDKYLLNGQGGLDPEVNPPAVGPDVYIPPTEDDPGTGFQPFLSDGVTPGPDYGRYLTLKLGSGNSGRISSGWFKALDLPCSDPDCPTNSGAQKYGWSITHCVGTALGIGDTIPIETGNMAGQTDHNVYDQPGQGAMALGEIDPDAYWDPVTKTIKGSCAPGICEDGLYYTESPRIVPVPLANMDAYLSTNPSGAGGSVTITNIFGFFIILPDQAATLGFDVGNGNTGDVVYGAMITIPGITKGTSTVPTSSAFLRQVILVR